jgi:ribosomal protein S18 acetylase RimI-like enzyme
MSQAALTIGPEAPSDAAAGELAELLVEIVARDGSVGFRHPLSPEAAHDYWRKALEDRGRVVFGARHLRHLVGTVTLYLDTPDNQRHRAEIWKMMVHPRLRRAGIADALLRAAEAEAANRGRTLLNLDTVTDGPAARLYERAGWTRSGDIPNYALTPMGEWTSTSIYYKRLAARA